MHSPSVDTIKDYYKSVGVAWWGGGGERERNTQGSYGPWGSVKVSEF